MIKLKITAETLINDAIKANDKYELNKLSFEKFKKEQMAMFDFSEEDFDRLMQLESEQPGIYRAITDQITRTKLDKLFRDRGVVMPDQGTKPHLIFPKNFKV